MTFGIAKTTEAEEARELGIDLPNGPVARLIVSGEPAGSIPATKKMIEAQWGAKVGDTVAIVESRPLSRRKRWVLTRVVEKAQQI